MWSPVHERKKPFQWKLCNQSLAKDIIILCKCELCGKVFTNIELLHYQYCLHFRGLFKIKLDMFLDNKRFACLKTFSNTESQLLHIGVYHGVIDEILKMEGLIVLPDSVNTRTLAPSVVPVPSSIPSSTNSSTISTSFTTSTLSAIKAPSIPARPGPGSLPSHCNYGLELKFADYNNEASNCSSSTAVDAGE